MSSFCEYAGTKPPKTPKWFAIDETRPLVAFAGIWTEWNGVRGTKANPVEGHHLLYGFLTTEPNSVVAPIHQGDAGHIDDAGGMGRVDARAVGGGKSVTATLARRYAKHHCERRA